MKTKEKFDIANRIFPVFNDLNQTIQVTHLSPNYLIFYNPKIGSSTIHNIRVKVDSQHFVLKQTISYDKTNIESKLSLCEDSTHSLETFNNHINNPNINKVFLYRNPFIKAVSGIIQDFKHQLYPTDSSLYLKHPNQTIYNKFFKSPGHLHPRWSSQKSKISYHKDLSSTILDKFDGKNRLEIKDFLCDCFEIFLEDLMMADNWNSTIQSELKHSRAHCYLIYELLEYGNVGSYEERDIVINLDNPTESYKQNWLDIFNSVIDIKESIQQNSRTNDWWLWDNVRKTKNQSILSNLHWLTEVLRFDMKFYNLLRNKYPYEYKLRYYFKSEFGHIINRKL